MVLAKIQVSFTFLSLLFTNRVIGIDAPIPGYDVVTIPWSLSPSPGAPAETFEGTVEEVLSSVLEKNPHFYQDFGISDHEATNTTPKRDESGLIEKRDTVNCNPNPNWHSAYLNGIQQGISYLRGVPGQPQRGPGPGSCGRVSCSYQCAIWWCNDVSLIAGLGR